MPSTVTGGAYTVDVEGSTTVDVPRRRRRRQRRHGAGRGQDRPHAAVRHGHVHPGRQVAQVHLHRGRHGRAVRPDRARLVGRRRCRDPDRRRRTVHGGQGQGRRLRHRRRGQRRCLGSGRARRASRGDGAQVTPRTSSEAVLLKGNATSSKRLVGQLALSSTPTATTVDLRPLALGKGTFQLVIKVKLGKKTKTFTKTQTTVKRLLQARHGQGRGGRRPSGHADRQAQVRQALGHARHRFCALVSRVDVPGSLATIAASDLSLKGAPRVQ